jgi:hypothetical protein
MSSLVAATLVVGLVLVAGASAAGAQEPGDESTPDNLIVLTGRAEVREGESFDHVMVGDGPIVIEGTVRDSVVALNGDVRVDGTAEDVVVALDGTVTVGASGHIVGDVVSRHRPVVEDGGRLDGSWERWNPRAWSRATAIATRVAWWLAVTVSTFLAGLALWLLVPRTGGAVHEAARSSLGPVIGWGVAFGLGLPIVAVLAMVTLVGLPLGLALLLALALIYGLAYTAAAWVLGRSLATTAHPLVSFLAGWGILRVIALIPILGGLVWCAAVVVGLGAIAVAAWRAGRDRAAARPADAPAPAPAPAPPPPVA